jgi:arsenate reductase
MSYPGESTAQHKPSVLFLCTGNSCRSQMAEGWLRKLHGEKYKALSAGIEAQGLNPIAIRVMLEAGVDITSQSSNKLDEFDLDDVEYVISVCDHAHENCPILGNHTAKLHYGFDDPPKLAANLEGEAALAPYRRVRDEVKMLISDIESFLAA